MKKRSVFKVFGLAAAVAGVSVLLAVLKKLCPRKKQGELPPNE